MDISDASTDLVSNPHYYASISLQLLLWKPQKDWATLPYWT